MLSRGFPSPSRNRTERQRKVCSGLWPSSQTPPKTRAGSGVSAPEGKASSNPEKKKEGKKKKRRVGEGKEVHHLLDEEAPVPGTANLQQKAKGFDPGDSEEK